MKDGDVGDGQLVWVSIQNKRMTHFVQIERKKKNQFYNWIEEFVEVTLICYVTSLDESLKNKNYILLAKDKSQLHVTLPFFN